MGTGPRGSEELQWVEGRAKFKAQVCELSLYKIKERISKKVVKMVSVQVASGYPVVL